MSDQTPQTEAPLAVAILKFTDRADGTLEIEATHDGVFEPMNQSHACLRAVVQFLPQICAPVGTNVDGAIGTKMPITHADRYEALRTLALIPEEDRNIILSHMTSGPTNEVEYDAMADKIVELCRGISGVPGAGQPERQVQLAVAKSELIQ